MIWNDAEDPVITFDDADESYAETLASLNDGFFKVRIDRLTKGDGNPEGKRAAAITGVSVAPVGSSGSGACSVAAFMA